MEPENQNNQNVSNTPSQPLATDTDSQSTANLVKHDRLGLVLVGILIASFLIPGLGLVAALLVIYFAIRGTKRNGQSFHELSGAQKAFKIIGIASITLSVLFIGGITLLFIIIASGGFQFG